MRDARAILVPLSEIDPEDDLRIPTVTVDAEVWCADGAKLHGQLFLPLAAPSHSGAARPDERLNDAAAFFPFAMEGARRPVLLGKARVLVVFVPSAAVMPPASSEDVLEGRSLPPPSMSTQVSIELSGERLSGVLAVDMPEYKSRVMDYLNRQERFLTLQMGARIAYVNRQHILRVVES